jgi:hypothetical protein
VIWRLATRVTAGRRKRRFKHEEILPDGKSGIELPFYSTANQTSVNAGANDFQPNYGQPTSKSPHRQQIYINHLNQIHAGNMATRNSEQNGTSFAPARLNAEPRP